MSTESLVSWLRGVLDDEERVALAAGTGPWRVDHTHSIVDWTGAKVAYSVGLHAETYPSPANSAHIIRWDPARALREVRAKRLLLDLHKECSASCYVVKVLAMPYAGRPGYQDDWRK